MRTPILVTMAALGLLCCASPLGCHGGSGDNSDAPPPPIDPAISAFLGNLRPGQSLADLKVKTMHSNPRGLLEVEVMDSQGRSLQLSVALIGQGALPPVTTKKYALYYGSAVGDAGTPESDKVTKALEALAERIRKTEDSVPAPAGMRAYGAPETSLLSPSEMRRTKRVSPVGSRGALYSDGRHARIWNRGSRRFARRLRK